MQRNVVTLFFVCMLPALNGGPVRADGPATRPATTLPDATAARPERVDPVSHAAQIARWFSDLASAEGKVRDAAKVGLMELDRADLPALRKLVAEHRPLQPSQAVVLKEIVTQMYLAGDTFETNGREGFLGIRPAEVSVGVRQPGDQPKHDNAEAQQALPNAAFPGGLDMVDPSQVCGILVMDRMPGFAGARTLQNGDVILGIVERPNIQLRAANEFSLAVRSMGAGQKVHFEVLRQGQVIRVEVILGPRPDDADYVPGGPNPMQGMLNRRDKEATDFWETQFAPLLDEGVG